MDCNHIRSLVYESSKRRVFLTQNKFFQAEDLAISFFEDRIVFSIPTLDYEGISHQTQKAAEDCRSVFITNENLPVGLFEIDQEESNEDQLVVYFEDEL